MELSKIQEELAKPCYNFIRQLATEERLCFVTVGGSIAYGTDIETSDIDIRGCAIGKASDLLLGKDFEQICRNNSEMDVTIYSFNKLVSLLKNINPNVIELLGNKPEHYFYISECGKLLLDNKNIFLTKKAVDPFFGYAHQQLHRLENKVIREQSELQLKQHILRKLKNLKFDGYRPYIGDDGNLYADFDIKAVPVEVFNSQMESVKKICNEYNGLGMRNKKAIEHDKLGKHMMHLVRLYIMCCDILEKGEINTYRGNEREFLLSIRNGKYLDDKNNVLPEFYELIRKWEERVEYAVKHTNLPPSLDETRLRIIDDMVRTVHFMEIQRGRGSISSVPFLYTRCNGIK